MAEQLRRAGEFPACWEMPAIQITQVLYRLRSLLIHAGLAYPDFARLVGSKYSLDRELCRAITCPAGCTWKQVVVGRCYLFGRWSKYVRDLHFLESHFGGFAWMLTPRPLKLSSTHLRIWMQFPYVFCASLNALNSCQTIWPCPAFSSYYIYNVCIKTDSLSSFQTAFSFLLHPLSCIFWVGNMN